MTTKEDGMSSKQQHCDYFRIDKNSSQFFNLNLSQSHQCSKGISHVQCFSKSNTDKKWGHTETKNYRENGKMLNKQVRSSSCTRSIIYGKAQKEEDRRHWWGNDKNDGANKRSSSTLSLHIAAYENFIDVQVEDSLVDKEVKRKDITSTSLKNLEQQSAGLSVNDQLEFPRQQENGPLTPEVQQFTASQRLYTPNQGAPSTQMQTPPSSLIQKMDIDEHVDHNPSISRVTAATKRKSAALSANDPSTSSNILNISTTKIGHEVDPEKRKSPSKRRSIIKPKRKPQAQGYYRRRLEFFDTKQNGTKEQVAIFNGAAVKGAEMIPSVMDGQLHPQHLYPAYHEALDSYLDASLLLRQTVLTERKLAAEVWGDNSIASFENGIYIVQKNLIEELMRPKLEDTQHLKAEPRKSGPKKRKESNQGTLTPPPPPQPLISYTCDDTDISKFLEFDDNMALTRSKTRAIRQQFAPSMSPAPAPSAPLVAPTVVSSKEKRKPVANNKDTKQAAKKNKQSKESSNTPTPPPPASRPPPQLPAPTPSVAKKNVKPVIQVKETPMPSFKMIEENKIFRNAQDFIKDTKVLQCYCKPNNGCDETCVNRILHMECGSRCPIGEKCQNKRFQNSQYAAFEPFFAGVKGWGIRATKPIQKGSFIVEYVGEVVDSWEMAKRQKKYTKANHKHHYMMSLRNGAVIDATNAGNFSRFVNHSCDPNAETQKWVVSREIRIGFFAKKDILPGEEIVFDYAFERFGKDAQECYCGSENCTGFIGSKPGEGDNDDADEEDRGSSETNSEASDDECSKDVVAVVKAAPKPKPTAEEKEFKKRVTKLRNKLKKARQEVRKVIGRKKNFSPEDILEFNRQMYRINDYDQKFLLTNWLISTTDDLWRKYFIDKNGIEVVWSWLTDFDGGVPLKTFVRLQNALIKILDSLPIEYNDNLKSIIKLVKDLKDVQLPDNIILQETLNEMIDTIADEPEIPDKDLARMLDRDKVSMIKLYDETVEICKRLYERWSKLPSKYTAGCTDISGDEMEDVKIIEKPNDEPIPAASMDSPETMDTDFDTPDYIDKSEAEISASPDQPSEKENNERKKYRSRSRSFSPRRRRRSRSKSPIGFQSYLHITANRDYGHRDDRRRQYDRSDYRVRDERRSRHYDDYYRSKRYDERYSDRYRGDRHYDNRRYDERRHGRYRGDYRNSYHRSYRHNDRYSDRHSYSRHRRSGSPHESRRRYSSSPERTKKSSHASRKELPFNELNSKTKSIFAKTIKVEIPETSPVIKSESPPEILSKTSSPAISVIPLPAIPVPPPMTSDEIEYPVTVASNPREIPYECVFPDAPRPVPPPPISYKPPQIVLAANGSTISSSSQYPGIANARPIRPLSIRIGNIQRSGFRQRFSQPVRMPIVVPPPPVMPPQFLPQMPPQPQNWYGYPAYSIPPPPAVFQPTVQHHPQDRIPQQIHEIPLPTESDVPDSQPSHETSNDSSVVIPFKEIKREELSPVVSDPVQSEPTPEEPQPQQQNGEIEKSKLRPYDKNPDWIETFTDDGIIYYYHRETRETRWEEPPPKESKKLRPVFQKSNNSNPSESVVPQNLNDLELKKQFKLKIWQNLHKYLKPKPEMQTVEEATLTQFARKMTHKTLEAELRNGNINLEITEKVYLRARQITDQHYALFIAENRTIKTEPQT